MQGTYAGDKETGRWIFWRKDGNKEMEGEFRRGKKRGDWLEWDETGQVKRRPYPK